MNTPFALSLTCGFCRKMSSGLRKVWHTWNQNHLLSSKNYPVNVNPCRRTYSQYCQTRSALESTRTMLCKTNCPGTVGRGPLSRGAGGLPKTGLRPIGHYNTRGLATLKSCLHTKPSRGVHYLCNRVSHFHLFLRVSRIHRSPCLTIIRRSSNNVNKTSPVPVQGSVAVPSRSELARLVRLAKPERWRIAGAVMFLMVSSGVTMAVPFCMGKVIDIIYTSMQEGNMIDRLTSICKILVGIFLIGGLANFGRVYLMQTSGNRIVKAMRERLFSSVIKQEVAFFDKTKTGELINRLSTDTSLVGQSVTLNISDGLRSTAQAIGGVSLMFYMSPKLASIALSIVPPVALLSIFYGRYVRRITRKVQDSLAEATQVAEERISNIRTVRAFAQEERELKSYRSRIEDVLQLSYKEAMARGIFWGSTGMAGNLIVLSVFYYGGLMMTESQITVGDLSAFLLYAAYVGVSIGGLSSFYTELNRGLGASSRVWELIDKPALIPTAGGVIPHTDLAGTIEFSDISFSYPNRNDIPIFSGLNLTVPQGSVMAVVGTSGSGKSTLASLLLRFYDPDSGVVKVDGTNIKDLDPTWLRSNIGTVSQEPALFSCTIRENIAYGATDPENTSEEIIIAAARKANAYDFIQSFPQGLDTMVGERGLMLSGGQKQRIAIARAILKDPKILLLDEATSALDAESEHLVQEALERLMVDRTVITIAHRLSTIRRADQIAVLDQGCIVELGSYDQLMMIKDGLFRKLVEKQTITNEE